MKIERSLVRICVVGPTYPYRGGIAHYTTLLVRHLRESGHWTQLYSFTRQYPRWLFPGKTDKDPSAVPLRVDCEYVLDPINPLTWWRLYRKVRADAPDLLLLQWWVPYWTPSLTVIAQLVKRNTSTPVAFICHNVVPHDGGGVLDRRLSLVVLRQGDGYIVHSEQDRYRLLALLPNANVVKTQIPSYAEVAQREHGSAAASAALRQRLGIAVDVPVMLFFGFVRPYKGLEYLVQALPHVLKERNVHLLVVGEFWSSPEFYQRYAEELGVTAAMTIVNQYVPNEDLEPYFDMADVVVLPYVSATQSAVAQLAFGFGKPVITTRVGGLHEVVRDGVDGLIVPPQDERALAEAIIRFYTDDTPAQMAAQVQGSHRGDAASWPALVRQVESLQRSIAAEKS